MCRDQLITILASLMFSPSVTLRASTQKCCLLQYFFRLTEAEKDKDFMKMQLSFEWLILKGVPDWFNCDKHLGVFVSCSRLIEENHEALQADFANKFIGGGVLTLGNVQVSKR